MAWLATLVLSLWCQTAAAQSVLTNGLSLDANLAVNTTNSHTLTAAVGDRIVVQLAKLTGGAGFTPRIEIIAPDGVVLATRSDLVAARIDLQADLGGTYTVRVSDLSRTGSGTYRVRLAQVPGAFEVAVGDDGGLVTNGGGHQGTIEVGDLDPWTIPASAGDRIAFQVAKLTGGAGFTPMIELFGPDGARIGVDSGGTAARLDAQAATTGTYTLLVSDLNRTGSGTYELRPAQIPGAFTVGTGDEGGATTDGANQNGTISVGDLDLWTFTAAAGDLVTVQITELTGGAAFQPMIELFTPGGERKRVASGATGATFDVAVEVPGTYTVLVSDANKTGSGTYQLQVTRGAIGPAAANVLVNGTSYLGTIAAAGETNSWTFTATAGETIAVHVGETATGNFLPWLRLYGPTGVQLADDFNASAAEVSVRATNSGTFVAVVADGTAGRNQTGNYRISLAKTGSTLAISPTDEGGVLTNGPSYLGTIDVGDVDAWNFTANAGESFVVWMGESSTGTTLLPWLRVYGPDGVFLVQDFNAAAAEVTVRATNSGTFLVIVADGNNGRFGAGNYRLSMAKTGSPLTISPTDEGGALTNGLSYLATLEVGDMDAWNFTANAGESFVVWMGETTAGANLLPWLRVFGPNGALQAGDFNATAAQLTVRATNSGSFLVIAADGNSGRFGAGNYRLSMAKTGSALQISPGDEGGPLVNGTSYLATTEVGDVDAWTIEATTGDTIVARMGESSTGTTLLPWLRLFGPDGTLLNADFNAGAAEATARVTNSGTFLIVASDGNSGVGGAGNYRLSAARSGNPVTISANDEGGTLTNGATYLASIEIGDIDAWTFHADVGENIVVRAGESSTGTTLLPWLRLYSPNGVLLDSGFSQVAAEATFRATNSGLFLLVAADGNSGIGGAGNYRLSLAKAGSPLFTSPEDEGGSMSGTNEYDGTIDAGDLDTWTFTAAAGEIITLNVTELVAGSPLLPWIRLYGWNGELLRSSFSATSGVISNFVAPANGTYTVVIGDGNSGIGGTGTYRLTANGLIDQLRLCTPVVSGVNGSLTGIGGVAREPFTLLSSTNAGTPLAQWTPLVVAEFDLYGVVTFTNVYDRAEPHRFFLLRRP